jgi:hypothetical protein
MTRTSNVIDISKRQKSRKRQNSVEEMTQEISGAGDTAADVVDMTERREAILSSERRQVKRTILSEFIGAFILVPEKGLQRVSIYDISENGVAFDMDLTGGGMREGEEVAMRVYLNQYTYFPFIVSVANVRALHDEGVTRHGCNFQKETPNHDALGHLVKFIESVSASLRTDHGDVMVSGIRR